jgi:hypothetical protein
VAGLAAEDAASFPLPQAATAIVSTATDNTRKAWLFMARILRVLGAEVKRLGDREHRDSG